MRKGGKKTQQTLVEKVDTTRDERRDNPVVLINRAPKVLLFVPTAPEHRPLVAFVVWTDSGVWWKQERVWAVQTLKVLTTKKKGGKKAKKAKPRKQTNALNQTFVFLF